VLIYVEFFGVSRLVTKVKEEAFDLPEGATFRDLVRLLRTRYPKLVREVIQPDSETLRPPNVFNLDGAKMIQPEQMDDELEDQNRIVLMSMSAGG